MVGSGGSTEKSEVEKIPDTERGSVVSLSLAPSPSSPVAAASAEVAPSSTTVKPSVIEPGVLSAVPSSVNGRLERRKRKKKQNKNDDTVSF